MRDSLIGRNDVIALEPWDKDLLDDYKKERSFFRLVFHRWSYCISCRNLDESKRLAHNAARQNAIVLIVACAALVVSVLAVIVSITL